MLHARVCIGAAVHDGARTNQAAGGTAAVARNLPICAQHPPVSFLTLKGCPLANIKNTLMTSNTILLRHVIVPKVLLPKILQLAQHAKERRPTDVACRTIQRAPG